MAKTHLTSQRQGRTYPFITNGLASSGLFSVAVSFALILSFLLTLLALYTRPSTPVVSAQSNDTLNFQARLLTSSGTIVPDGTYNVEFKLYDQPTGGTELWTETREFNTDPANLHLEVRSGYLSVYLGDKTPFPASIDWNNQHYLTMNIGGTDATPAYDGEMTPRIRLTSVPYAFAAETANLALDSEQLDGRTADEFVQLSPASTQTGNINVSGTGVFGGNLSTGSNLIADGTLSIQGGGDSSISGNLGIGTINPQTSLDVNGGIRVGNSTVNLAGVIRWTGTDLQVYDGSQWTSLTDGSGGGSAGVEALNTLTGSLTLQGTTNQVIISDNGTDTLTLSLPQDIHTGANVTFGSLLVEGTSDQVQSRIVAYSTQTADLTQWQTDSNQNLLRVRNDGAIVQDHRVDSSVIGNIDAGTTVFSIDTAGNYAYIGINNATNAFRVIDVSNHQDPVEVASLNLDGSVRSIRLNGSYAYVGTTSTNEGFHVIDISNPAEPVEVGSLQLPETVSGMYVSGRYAYIGTQTGTEGFHVIDISNPAEPVEVGNYNLDRGITDIRVSGGYAYITLNTNDFDNFVILDVSDVANPTLAGSMLLATLPNAIDVSGRYAYVAAWEIDGNAALYVIDISNPSTTSIVDSVLLAGTPRSIDISNRYAYVGIQTGIVRIIDISNPNNVSIVADANISGTPWSMRLNGKYLYIGSNTAGSHFQVLDLGGADLTVANIGTTRTGTLFVGTSAQVGRNLSVSGGISAGSGGIYSAGNLAVSGISQFTGSLTVGAGSSLRLTGSDTFPSSPSEGELYYRTDQSRLYIYADSQWTNLNDTGTDSRTATMIVAADDSPAPAKASADYVTDGTSDQVEINNALTAAAGGYVYLHEGTYTVDASISIPNNTTLAGAGKGTVITIPNSHDANIDIITNSDTTTGTNVILRDFRIDGNKANNSSGTQRGIYFENMGGGEGSGARPGSKITSLTVEETRSDGIRLNSSNHNAISNVTLKSTNTDGLFLDSSNYNTVTGSVAYDINWAGFITSASEYNTFTGNNAHSNDYGFFLDESPYSTISGNTVKDSSNYGIYLQWQSNSSTIVGNTVTDTNGSGVWLSSSSDNTVTGNVFKDNSSQGIEMWDSHRNVISANNVKDSGWDTDNNGIWVEGSSDNSIIGNVITDGSATNTNYAINIPTDFSNNNYLANNTLGGGSIRDEGTDTIYANQRDGNGNFINRTANSTTMFQLQDASGSVLLNADTTNMRIGIGTDTPAYALDVVTTDAIAGRFSGRVIGADAVNNDEFVTLGQLSDGLGGLSDEYFLQGGNAFSETAVLGTTDNYGLQFITNNTTRMTIGNDGTTTLAGNFLPGADDTYNLGSSTNRWRDLYLGPQSLNIGTDANNAAISYSTSTSRLELSSDTQIQGNGYIDGSLGVGTTAPQSLLSVMAGSGQDDLLRVVTADAQTMLSVRGAYSGWEQITTGSMWSARSDFGLLSYDDSLWVIGGIFPGTFGIPTWSSSVFRSDDGGANWTQTTSSASFGSLSSAYYYTFDNKMWVAGGFNGSSDTDDVYSSTDGVTWTLEAGAPGFGNRADGGYAVFDNKMWVVGGYNAGSSSTLGDVWSSTDGVNWTEEAATTPWSNRSDIENTTLVFDNKLWIMGGSTNGASSGALNDVWSSTDGVNWTEETSSANWPARLDAGGAVYDGKMWIYGGQASGGGTLNDVWSSTDGINWTQESDAPWPTRRTFGTTLHQDSIYVMGGQNSSRLNDVWRYSINDGGIGIGTTTPRYYLEVDRGGGVVARFSGRVIGANAENDNEFLTLGQANSLYQGSGDYFTQGGNTFGATATLGTADNNPLELITNNQARVTIAADGSNVTLASGMNLLLQGNATISNPGTGTDSEQFGSGASASGNQSTAIGNTAQADDFNNVAVGYNATSSGQRSTVVGAQASSEGGYATVLGQGSFGSNESVVLGASASSGLNSFGNIAIGPYSTLANDSFENILLGYGGSIGSDESIGIGSGVDVQGASSIAMGLYASTGAAASNAIALGNSATANHTNSIALGRGATTTAGNQLMIGSTTYGLDIINQYGNLALGRSSADYRLDVESSGAITARFSGRVIGADAVNTNEFVTLSQLNAATGGAGVASVNTLDGALTLQGTTNEIAVTDNGTDTITLGLPSNVTIETLTLSNALSVSNGGTGAASFTQYGVLYGNGTSALGVTAVGGAGDCLLSSGGSSAPTWGDCGGGTGVGGGGTADRLAVFTDPSNVGDSWLVQNTSTLELDSTRNLSLLGGDLSVAGNGSFTGSLTVGSTSGLGELVLHDGTGETTTLRAGASTANLTFTLPGADGNSGQCLKTDGSGDWYWSNCNNGSGSGGDITLQDTYDASGSPASIVTSSTSKNVIIRSGSGFDTDNMFQLQNASGNRVFTADTSNGRAVLGHASTLNGQLSFANSTNGNLVTIETGATSSPYTLTLPTALGSQDQCLVDTTGTGTLGWVDCGPGVSSGVDTINSLDGSLTLQGTANEIAVSDNGTDTITLSLPSSVTINTLTLSSALSVGNGGTGATTAQGAINNISGLTTEGDLLFHNGTNATRLARGTEDQCLISTTTSITWATCPSGSGSGVDTVGTLDSQTKSSDGAVISGTTLYLQTADELNPGLVSTGTQTFAGDKTFSGATTIGLDSTTAFQVQNATSQQVFGVNTTSGSVLLGESNTLTGTLVVNNASNSNTITIQSGTTSSSYTLTLPTSAPSTGQCLVAGSGGQLNWGSCGDGGGGSLGLQNIKLTPEFAGGTLYADGTNNSGVMTASYAGGLSAAQGYQHTFYEWSSSESTPQHYDVVINHALASTFNATNEFEASSWKVWTYVDSTTTGDIEFTIRSADGTTCVNAESVQPGAAGAWEQITLSTNPNTSCSFAPNDRIIISVRLIAEGSSADKVRLGAIEYEYTP